MSEAKQIYAAMVAVMGEVGVVGKDRKNPQQGYSFRGIDDVAAHCQQALVKHGVVVMPRVLERERELVPTKSGGSMASVRLLVEHTFYAKDGSSVVAVTLGEAMDSGDKASNKAMSAALKYALTESLMIPTYEADRDTEEQSPQMAPKAKATPPAKPPPVDDLAREVGLIRAACEAARTVADVDALARRFAALPPIEQAELKPVLSARKAALGRVS